MRNICGNWIGVFLLFAQFSGNAAMFISELLEDSFQLEGLTACDVLPRSTGLHWRHPQLHTPIPAICTSLLCILAIVSML